MVRRQLGGHQEPLREGAADAAHALRLGGKSHHLNEHYMAAVLLQTLLLFWLPKKKSVDVTVPEIEEMRLAHYVTMGSECTASLAAKYLDSM